MRTDSTLKNWGTKTMGSDHEQRAPRTPCTPLATPKATEACRAIKPPTNVHPFMGARCRCTYTQFGCTLPASAMRRWACLGFGIPSGARGARGARFTGYVGALCNVPPATCPDAVALHPKQQSTEDEPVSDVIVITVAENDAWQKLKANGHDLSKLTTDEQVAYCGLVDRLLTSGPASFREQAEAKAAECFGENIAAKLVRRKT